MLLLFRVVLIASLIIILFKKRKEINQILEKKVILNLLLFTVSLFIKTEKNPGLGFKNRISKFMYEKLLFLDLWILNFRSDKKTQKIFIKNEKRGPKNPDC